MPHYIENEEDRHEIEVTVQFTSRHIPASHTHLMAILENYLKPKGVTVKDGKIII